MSEVDYRILWTSRLPAYNCFLACFFFGNHLKVSVNAVKIKRNKCINVFPQLILFTHKIRNILFTGNEWLFMMKLFFEHHYRLSLQLTGTQWAEDDCDGTSRTFQQWSTFIWDIQSHVDRLWRWAPSLIGIPLLLWQHTSSSGLLSHQNRGGIAVGSVLINLTCCYFL